EVLPDPVANHPRSIGHHPPFEPFQFQPRPAEHGRPAVAVRVGQPIDPVEQKASAVLATAKEIFPETTPEIPDRRLEGLHDGDLAGPGAWALAAPTCRWTSHYQALHQFPVGSLLLCLFSGH